MCRESMRRRVCIQRRSETGSVRDNDIVLTVQSLTDTRNAAARCSIFELQHQHVKSQQRCQTVGIPCIEYRASVTAKERLKNTTNIPTTVF